MLLPELSLVYWNVLPISFSCTYTFKSFAKKLATLWSEKAKLEISWRGFVFSRFFELNVNLNVNFFS